MKLLETAMAGFTVVIQLARAVGTVFPSGPSGLGNKFADRGLEGKGYLSVTLSSVRSS